MKSYNVFMDITISKSISIEANSEEEAMKIAEERVKNNPYDYARKADGYVSCEIYDIYEEE